MLKIVNVWYFVLHSTVKCIYLCIVNLKIMNIENTKTQMSKGIFEYCILSLLRKEDKYASEIIEIFSKTKFDIVEGTIYPILTRLKNASYLSYYWQESHQGPPRKYYKITSEGLLFLDQLDEIWSDIEKSVKQIINY